MMCQIIKHKFDFFVTFALVEIVYLLGNNRNTIIMKPILMLVAISLSFGAFVSCNHANKKPELNIIFLHHSTGEVIWNGNMNAASDRVSLPLLFKKYNKEQNKKYSIKEMIFPKEKPYGWHNYPYDYYNIWVKNAGENPYMEEPTLEILTKKYQVIIFKHCFPVCNISADLDSADINSNIQTLENYKLQYLALREKLKSFPETKFIVFTGAALIKHYLSEEEAVRAKEFFTWVNYQWDLPDDNIYLWDLYSLQTDGTLYFKDEYAISPTNSHPNENFAGRVDHLLFNRIIDVIENNGIQTQITGEPK